MPTSRTCTSGEGPVSITNYKSAQNEKEIHCQINAGDLRPRGRRHLISVFAIRLKFHIFAQINRNKKSYHDKT